MSVTVRLSYGNEDGTTELTLPETTAVEGAYDTLVERTGRAVPYWYIQWSDPSGSSIVWSKTTPLTDVRNRASDLRGRVFQGDPPFDFGALARSAAGAGLVTVVLAPVATSMYNGVKALVTDESFGTNFLLRMAGSAAATVGVLTAANFGPLASGDEFSGPIEALGKTIILGPLASLGGVALVDASTEP